MRPPTHTDSCMPWPRHMAKNGTAMSRVRSPQTMPTSLWDFTVTRYHLWASRVCPEQSGFAQDIHSYARRWYRTTVLSSSIKNKSIARFSWSDQASWKTINLNWYLTMADLNLAILHIYSFPAVNVVWNLDLPYEIPMFQKPEMSVIGGYWKTTKKSALLLVTGIYSRVGSFSLCH